MMEKAACESGKDIVLKTGGDCDPPVFKLLEKQNQAQQKEKEAASGLYFLHTLGLPII
jgi:hypothetical protein